MEAKAKELLSFWSGAQSERALGFLRDDVIIEALGPVEFPLFGIWKGKKKAEEFYSLYHQLLDFKRDEPREIISTPGTVVVFLDQSGILKNTRKIFDSKTVWHIKFAGDGGISNLSIHTNTHSLFRAYLK